MSRIKYFTRLLCDLSPVPRTYQSRPLCVGGVRRMKPCPAPQANQQ